MQGKPEQFPKVEILDDTERLARGWGSVEIRDRDGELLPIDEFKRLMPVIMDRGGPIADSHSNRLIGKILNYEFKTEPDSGKEGVLLTYKIFKNFQTDNEVWEEIKNGDRTGLSFGGRNKKFKFSFDKDGRLENTTKILYDLEGFEFSSVKKPANQGSLNTQVNYLAKGDVNKPEDKRPPKEWWDSCVSRARSFADDPDKFCGALWHNPEQFEGGSKLRGSFGKSDDVLFKGAIVNFEKQLEDKKKMTDENVTKEDLNKILESLQGFQKGFESMKDSVDKIGSRVDALEKQKMPGDDEEEGKKPEEPEEEEKKKEEKQTLPAPAGEDETTSGKPSQPAAETENFAEKGFDKETIVKDITKGVLDEIKKAGLQFGGEAQRPGVENINKTAGNNKDKDDYVLKVARGEVNPQGQHLNAHQQQVHDELIAKVFEGKPQEGQ